MSDLPSTLEAALTPEWLNAVLPSDPSDPRIVRVEERERVQDISFKPKVVRFIAHYADETAASLCLKAVLPHAHTTASDRRAAVEARFFRQVAPHLPINLPPVLVALVGEAQGTECLVMRDMVAEGASFLDVLVPWEIQWVTTVLDQLASLHALSFLAGSAEKLAWVPRNVDWLAQTGDVGMIQDLLDGPRSAGLPGRTRDAGLAIESMRAYAAMDRQRVPFLLHGDTHASNVFVNGLGAGLMDWQMVQKGNWALDVAYHITAVLPIDVAEREERDLIAFYLDRARAYGAAVPGNEDAWLEYRQSLVYGHFLASITRSMAPEIIAETSKRLAHAVHRHDTFALLGL